MGVVNLAAYKPVPGTVGDANAIANGMSAIEVAVNAIDNTNFAAGKIFDPAKLMQNAATDKQALLWDNASSTWKPGTVATTLYQQKTTSKLVNTTTETDLLNGEITVAANPGVNALIRLTASGDNLGNNGIQTSARFKVKFGGTTLLDTNVLSSHWAASATRAAWRAVVEIQNLGVANAQTVTLELFFGEAATNNSGGVAFTTGTGQLHAPATAAGSILHALGQATGALDTATSKLLELTVTLPSGTTTECKLFGAKLEVTP